MTPSSEPRWVPTIAVESLHHLQILEHGGLPGVRQLTALEAALARPKQRWSYGELKSIPALGAAYADALVRAHAFNDGNKRTGFLVSVVFLGLNGFCFEASNESVVMMIQRLAAGLLEWPELEAWFVENAKALR
jgi:death on curing protein